MNDADHKWVGPSMHDRIIGALETCCRQGEMLRIQNRHVDWEQHQIAIPGHNAKDAENRRIPFDPHGRLAPILKRRATLGPNAFVFGSPARELLGSFKTAWESLLLVANGHETKRAKPGARVDRAKLRQIDLHWHDLRYEAACRLLADGVDIRTIQLMLGHADIKQTQRYLNITDEDERDRDGRERDRQARNTFARHVRLPRGPERELVRDRDREYSLRGSESHTLATVGAFRVVSSRDLRDHNDRAADPRSGDLRHLREQA